MSDMNEIVWRGFVVVVFAITLLLVAACTRAFVTAFNVVDTPSPWHTPLDYVPSLWADQEPTQQRSKP